MKITSVQMTATLWIDMSQEDLDMIWACAEKHYDCTVQQMTRQGGVLFGIKNQLTCSSSASTNVHLGFRDLDTMAKALEQSHLLGLVGGLKLHGKIYAMLRFINSKFSVLDASEGAAETRALADTR